MQRGLECKVTRREYFHCWRFLFANATHMGFRSVVARLRLLGRWIRRLLIRWRRVLYFPFFFTNLIYLLIVFVIRSRQGVASCFRLIRGHELCGVIVYSYPPPSRNGRHLVFPRMTIQEMNKQLSTINRVVIHPKYRTIGLGAKLIRETLTLMGTSRWNDCSYGKVFTLRREGRLNPQAEAE